MSNSNRESIGRLFSDSHEALRRYIRRKGWSKETTEDIVQEAFLRTYEQAEHVEIPRAFLFAAARNLAFDVARRDQVRKAKPLEDFDLPNAESQHESLESKAMSEERSRLLKEAVEHLTPQCRAAFTLRVFYDYSHREIAERMGVAPKTVENHIVRGLRETHDYLQRRYRMK